MSQKAKLIKANELTLNPKAAKQLAEIDKSIRKVSDRDKRKLIKDGLSVKSPDKLIFKKVNIKKIVHSTYFIRFKARETYDDFDMVTKPDPIKVAVTKDKKLYFLVDGEGRLEFARRRGEKQVDVEIIGTIVCQSQIGMARGREMVKFKKPLTPLELAQGLMQLEDQLKRDFGEDAFFSHGGDRKAAVESKKSLSEYIAETLGLKKSTVKILIRFGRNVGPIGLVGLLTNGHITNISLWEINKINAGLKDSDILKKIGERANEMIEAGATQDDLINEVGDLASKIIQCAEAPTPDDNEDNDDDNEDETDSGKLPPMPKLRKSKKDENGDDNDNDDDDDEVEDAKPKKKIKPTKIVKIISSMQMVLKQLNKDFKDCKRIDEVDHPIVEAKLKRLEGYWGELYGKLGEAGFS